MAGELSSISCFDAGSSSCSRLAFGGRKLHGGKARCEDQRGCCAFSLGTPACQHAYPWAPHNIVILCPSIFPTTCVSAGGTCDAYDTYILLTRVERQAEVWVYFHRLLPHQIPQRQPRHLQLSKSTSRNRSHIRPPFSKPCEKNPRAQWAPQMPIPSIASLLS